MQALYTIPSAGWNGPFAAQIQEQAIDALEQGKVLFFPDLAFPLEKHETDFLSPQTVRNSKNVSFDPATGKAGGTGVCGISCRNCAA